MFRRTLSLPIRVIRGFSYRTTDGTDGHGSTVAVHAAKNATRCHSRILGRARCNSLVAFAALIVAIIVSGTAVADEATMPDAQAVVQRAAAEFKAADRDGDGALTRSEFLARGQEAGRADRARRFLVFDFDGNGTLDAKEYHSFIAPVDQRGEVPDPITEIERADLAKWEAIFTAADRDRDGVLSRDEWPARQIASEIPLLADVGFSLWDRAGDGKIDRADGRWLFEMAYGLTQLDGRPLRTNTGRVFSWYYFRKLDGDGNGFVSREEFVSRHHSGEENAAIFATLDADGDGQLTDRETWSLLWHDTIGQFLDYDSDLDGYLSADEMEGIGWGRTIARQCVPAFDGDGDGKLSYREFRQTTFANQASDWPLRHDNDRDGRLSWHEFYVERTPLLIAQSRFLFSHFDHNRDGILSALEFTIEGDANQMRILAYVGPALQCLPLEVALARQVCQLSDKQAAALERAGRGAIERWAGEMVSAMQKGRVRIVANGNGRAVPQSMAAELARSPHLVVRRELAAALRSPVDVHGDLAIVLDVPDVWKKLDAECQADATRQRRAAAWAYVALLDEVLLLSARQRDELCDVLAKETNDAWWRPANAGLTFNHESEQLFAQLAGRPLGSFVVPDNHLAKMLTPTQLATFKAQQQPRRQEVMIARQAVPAKAAQGQAAQAGAAVPAIKAPVAAAAAAPGMLAGQAAKGRIIVRIVGRRPAVDDQQAQLARYMELRLADIDAACGLSAAQCEKLTLAAKLDISHWRDELPPLAAVKLRDGEEVVIQHAVVRGDTTPLPPIFAAANSLFQKSLRGRLLDEQKQKLAEADRRRRDFQRQSLVESVVLGFATAASLTSQQCDLLATALRTESPDDDPRTADWRLSFLRRLAQLPDERFRSIAHDFQWDCILRQQLHVAEAARQYEMRQQGK